MLFFICIIFTFIGRPAEIAEEDVYLCESIYDETTKQIRELPKDGLKKYTHSSAVNQDEFYFFRRLIHPVKVITILLLYLVLNFTQFNLFEDWRS